MRCAHGKRDFTGMCIDGLILEFKWRPGFVQRLIIHRPEAAPTKPLFDLDLLA